MQKLIFFLPNINSIYEEDDEVLIKAPQNSYVLEGLTRPGHFDGVLQVVLLKLFNLTQATNAYFGKRCSTTNFNSANGKNLFYL